MVNSIFFSIEKMKKNKLTAFIQITIFLWIFSIPLKNAFYQITTILLIILFLVHFFYFGSKKQLLEVWQSYKLIFLLFIGFIVAMTLSSLFGIGGHKAFSEIPKYAYRYPLVLFIFLYLYKQSIFSRKWLLSVILITLFIHALDGVYQYITGIDFIKHLPIPIDGHITGAVFNPNPYGLVMATGAIVSLVYFFEPQQYTSDIKKAFYFFALLLFLAVLFYTQSRAAWVMFSCFFTGYMIVYLKQYGLNKKLIISLFFIFILITLLFLNDSNLHQRLQSLMEGYSSGRMDIWLFTLNKIKENPILGYGVDSFRILAANTHLNHYAGPHNTLLEIFLFTGIIGFSVFITLIFAALKESFTKEKILYGLFFLSYLLLLQFDGSLIRGKIHLSVFIIVLFFIYSFRLDRKRSSASE